jgi:hypothetical protein
VGAPIRGAPFTTLRERDRKVSSFYLYLWSRVLTYPYMWSSEYSTIPYVVGEYSLLTSWVTCVLKRP